MIKLSFIVLMSMLAFHGFAQGTSTDTTSFLLNGNLDKSTAWSFSLQSGSSGTLRPYNGINGDGLSLTYTFPPSGGWINLEIPVGSSFTKSNPMVFFIFTPNLPDKLEIKFIDKDGTVFAVMPALSKFAGGWKHITVYLDNTNYAWGGNTTFDTPSKFSLAISGPGASNGTVIFDEIGIGKAGLPSSFLPTIDPNSQLPGIGFVQRRDSALAPEDPLVLKYLEAMQDQSSIDGKLVATYKGGVQAHTFNNSLTALAFIVKDEKERAERILDFYLNATDSNNMDLLKQNFFYKGDARGFFQECDIHTLKAIGARNRWIGDMAWLLITCKNYQLKYHSTRYEYLVQIIKDLFLSFYKDADTGGFIQHGWENGDEHLHNTYGHHEGNIDCYVALKLSGEELHAHQIKTWLDNQLKGHTALPLDLYTWRTLAFGAMDESYVSLLNIPEYDFRYRKIIAIQGREVTGLYSSSDLAIQNFWNDGTGHIACAFQAFGDMQRGYFYANQMDYLIVEQTIANELTHGLPYTLNTQGYEGVDPSVPVVSSSAWYILAKNGYNPFLSENFNDHPTVSNHALTTNSPDLKVFPNPFSTTVTIINQQPYLEPVTIQILNSEGIPVRSMNYKSFPAGSSITWDGTNDKGNNVTPGIYFFMLKSEKYWKNARLLYFPK